MKPILLFFCYWVITTASAQTTSFVEGGVADSSGIALPAATVVLLQAKDSVLVAFGVTDPDGRFRLPGVAAGDYLLQISYVGYQNHTRVLVLPADKIRVQTGRILLAPANLLLQGVDIKAEQAPLVMRKDTLEYDAGAFKTQPGAVVEDLLKKLPRVQVQSDGTIKAQGETVQNVLVDGKEFFGQDPKVAENGFTQTWAGGMNFNSELSPKTKLSASYFYSRLQNDMERSTTRTNLLGGQSFGSREAEDRLSRTASHRLNLMLRHKPDSASSLILRSRLTGNDAGLQSQGESASSDPDGQLQNTGLRDYFSNGNILRANTNLTYRRHLGRKGRSLIADLGFQYGDDRRMGNLRAQNDYWGATVPLSETLHQRQRYSDASTHYSASLAYTEPLARRQYFEWQLARQLYANRTGKDFYDILETPTPGEVFNPLLSNRFRRGYRYDRAAMN